MRRPWQPVANKSGMCRSCDHNPGCFDRIEDELVVADLAPGVTVKEIAGQTRAKCTVAEELLN